MLFAGNSGNDYSFINIYWFPIGVSVKVDRCFIQVFWVAV